MALSSPRCTSDEHDVLAACRGYLALEIAEGVFQQTGGPHTTSHENTVERRVGRTGHNGVCARKQDTVNPGLFDWAWRSSDENLQTHYHHVEHLRPRRACPKLCCGRQTAPQRSNQGRQNVRSDPMNLSERSDSLFRERATVFHLVQRSEQPLALPAAFSLQERIAVAQHRLHPVPDGRHGDGQLHQPRATRRP